MNLSYFFSGCMIFVFLVAFSNVSLYANNGGEDGEKIVIEDLKTEADFEAVQNLLAERVEGLKIAKKDAVTKSDKKALRAEIKEVKSDIKAVNKAAKKIGGGIYLGVGALLAIIIVLLLI